MLKIFSSISLSGGQVKLNFHKSTYDGSTMTTSELISLSYIWHVSVKCFHYVEYYNIFRDNLHKYDKENKIIWA